MRPPEKSELSELTANAIIALFPHKRHGSLARAPHKARAVPPSRTRPVDTHIRA